MNGQTDGWTDGIAVASTVFAMRALRHAVKIGVVLHQTCSESQWTALLGYLTITTNARCY